jgi:deferrochelatase/peroxidase EfeB
LGDGNLVCETNFVDLLCNQEIKLGAPIDITPLKDDPALGNDASKNNNFTFSDPGQDRCPYAAHIRKSNPRSDLLVDAAVTSHRLWRQGISNHPSTKILLFTGDLIFTTRYSLRP